MSRYNNKYVPVDESSSPTPSKFVSKESKRSLAFRKSKNAEFMEKLKKQLDIELFANVGGQDEFINTIKFSTSERSVNLGCSLRGVGLLLNQSVLRTTSIAPNIIPPIPALYRTSLAQMQAKLKLTSDQDRTVALRQIGTKTTMPIELFSATVSRPRNFVAVANAISQVGSFTFNDTVFVPRASPNNLLGYMLTDLRDYVTRMSNLDTPLEERQRAFSLNAVPSAVWQTDLVQVHIHGVPAARDIDGNLIPQQEGQPPALIADPATLSLRNPDEVIPDGYSINGLLDDFRECDVYYERLGRKFNRYLGDVDYDSKGSPGLFISTSIGDDPIRLNSSHSADGALRLNTALGVADDWRSQRAISVPDSITGMLCLHGEIQTMMPARMVYDYDAFRADTTAAQVFSENWLSVIEALL